MKNKIPKYNKGFTIMETLVAIFILLLAVTGPMIFAQSALRSSYQSRDQITAFFLAQDAMEFIKNRKDHNVLAGSSADWLDDIITSCNSASGCSVYTNKETSNNDAFVSCVPGNVVGCLGGTDANPQDNHLKIDTTNGFIGDTGNKDSIFSRTVYVEQGPYGNSAEARITVKVRWKSHESLGFRSIEVVEYVYNWASVIGL